MVTQFLLVSQFRVPNYPGFSTVVEAFQILFEIRKHVLTFWNHSLLLGKFEAYSVLHTMYLWMRVG